MTPGTRGVPRTRSTFGALRHLPPDGRAADGVIRSFARGSIVAADGGTPDVGEDPEVAGDDPAAGEAASDAGDAGTLADVDHEPAGPVDGAQDTFDRGRDRGGDASDE